MSSAKNGRWLCDIPDHWDVRRNGRLFHQTKLAGSADLPILSVSLHDGVTVRDMDDDAHRQVIEDRTKYKRVATGDLAYNMMRMWQGAVGLAPADGLVSPAYVTARPYHDVNAKYYEYLFRTSLYMGEIEGYSRGIVSDRNRLYWEEFKQMPSPYPPRNEQDAIVAFLDRKLAEIDRFIANKRRLIQLLNEQMTAVIEQVLRGSRLGAERVTPFTWCPTLPKSYAIERLRFCLGYQEGPGIMAADFLDTGVPLLRISCLKGDIATLDGCNFLSPEKVDAKWNHFRVKRGDYLISASASFGSMCLVTKVAEGAVPYTGIIRVWPKRGDVLMEYIKLFMRSKMFLDQIEMLKAGTAIQHFGPTHLGRMFLVLPSKADQERLVDEVSEIGKNLAKQHSAIEREIEVINEFRASLIAEAVTGKINVRSKT